jgi:hypothetical protein
MAPYQECRGTAYRSNLLNVREQVDWIGMFKDSSGTERLQDLPRIQAFRVNRRDQRAKLVLHEVLQSRALL